MPSHPIAVRPSERVGQRVVAVDLEPETDVAGGDDPRGGNEYVVPGTAVQVPEEQHPSWSAAEPGRGPVKHLRGDRCRPDSGTDAPDSGGGAVDADQVGVCEHVPLGEVAQVVAVTHWPVLVWLTGWWPVQPRHHARAREVAAKPSGAGHGQALATGDRHLDGVDVAEREQPLEESVGVRVIRSQPLAAVVDRRHYRALDVVTSDALAKDHHLVPGSP